MERPVAACNRNIRMNIPSDLKFGKTHEWFRSAGNVVTVGVTQYAADELTDITYVELPSVGDTFEPGDAVCEVESVKATSEVFCAVGGEVVEVNTALVDHPELINDEAFDGGWLIKLRVGALAPLADLMDADAYARHIAE